jgi:tartrate-resistant acid phosphatase type 5
MIAFVYILVLLQNLSSSLEASQAKWKIAVGHHTMRSGGKHGETLELLDQVLPILEVCDPGLFLWHS